jgi:hypothetical protein
VHPTAHCAPLRRRYPDSPKEGLNADNVQSAAAEEEITKTSSSPTGKLRSRFWRRAKFSYSQNLAPIDVSPRGGREQLDSLLGRGAGDLMLPFESCSHGSTKL